MKNSLIGKIAVVTGAGRGIGRAIAIALAKAGAKTICVSKSLSNCQETARIITDMGLSAKAYIMDVSDPKNVDKVANEILCDFNTIDILINNAGLTRDNLMVMMSNEEWNDVISTNLSGVFYVTRAFAPEMMCNNFGRIINISSVNASNAVFGQVNYSSSKAGVNAMTKNMALELYSKNITVNAISPGFIATDMLDEVPQKILDSTQKLLNRIGTPEDIARMCVFLCQKDSDYITGQIIKIDGGLSINK